MVYGRPYSMQVQKNRVISKCWKLVWCMAEPTVCRSRKIESSASVGNSYGVWQTLLYADANRSSHQQGLEIRMVYGRHYLYRCRKIQSSPSAGNSYGIWQTLLYADADKSSHQQGLETHTVYGRHYPIQMHINRVISKCWKLVWCMPTLLYADAVKLSHQKVWKLVCCMADLTLCRCTQIESSPSVGNSYGVWQTLLYADAEK